MITFPPPVDDFGCAVKGFAGGLSGSMVEVVVVCGGKAGGLFFIRFCGICVPDLLTAIEFYGIVVGKGWRYLGHGTIDGYCGRLPCFADFVLQKVGNRRGEGYREGWGARELYL